MAAEAASTDVPPVPPTEEGGAEGGAAYTAGGTSDVGALMAMDGEDEALARYKASLLGAAATGDLGDTSDGRRVVVTEFRIEFEEAGVADFVAELDTPEKIAALAKIVVPIKQGAKYKLKISFLVNGEIVDSLKFKNVVKRLLVSETEEVMIGSYAPSSTANVFVSPRFDWTVAPAGMVFRGKYAVNSKFIDLHGTEHLQFTWGIKIATGWS